VRAAETAFPVAIILSCQEVERPIYWTSSRTWSGLAPLGIVRNKLHGEIYDGNCDPKAKQNKNSDSFRPTRVRVRTLAAPILILTGREERRTRETKKGKKRKEKKRKKRTERPI